MVVGPTPAAAADANDLVTVRNGYTFASMDGSANSFACAQRYRSSDPASGTYLGYYGNRHPRQ
jgi:hypothetical protein